MDIGICISSPSVAIAVDPNHWFVGRLGSRCGCPRRRGHWWKALILLAWGAGVVGQSHNVIRPYVISKRAQLNTLLVFFALLGGVEAFGVSSSHSHMWCWR